MDSIRKKSPILNKEIEAKAWRDVKHAQRFLNAFRGIYVVKQSTRHFSFHMFVTLLVIICGFYFKVSSLEWIALVFAIGFVFTAEAFNTAIEIDIDLTSPEYHPYAKDTKDVAAGAVLFATLTAVIVGLIVFLPKIF
ncbi:MAG: diacylglycerol kinase family protein [Candidatus Paceibacterota bacterium]|jgi:diacylglycerol kinase